MSKGVGIMAFVAFLVYLMFMAGGVAVDILEGRKRDLRLQENQQTLHDVRLLLVQVEVALKADEKRDEVDVQNYILLTRIAERIGVPIDLPAPKSDTTRPVP